MDHKSFERPGIRWNVIIGLHCPLNFNFSHLFTFCLRIKLFLNLLWYTTDLLGPTFAFFLCCVATLACFTFLIVHGLATGDVVHNNLGIVQRETFSDVFGLTNHWPRQVAILYYNDLFIYCGLLLCPNLDQWVHADLHSLISCLWFVRYFTFLVECVVAFFFLLWLIICDVHCHSLELHFLISWFLWLAFLP